MSEIKLNAIEILCRSREIVKTQEKNKEAVKTHKKP